ncbi:hypothetical protein ACJX0J_017633 [Zea mays]
MNNEYCQRGLLSRAMQGTRVVFSATSTCAIEENITHNNHAKNLIRGMHLDFQIQVAVGWGCRVLNSWILFTDLWCFLKKVYSIMNCVPEEVIAERHNNKASHEIANANILTKLAEKMLHNLMRQMIGGDLSFGIVSSLEAEVAHMDELAMNVANGAAVAGMQLTTAHLFLDQCATHFVTSHNHIGELLDTQGNYSGLRGTREAKIHLLFNFEYQGDFSLFIPRAKNLLGIAWFGFLFFKEKLRCTAYLLICIIINRFRLLHLQAAKRPGSWLAIQFAHA